ncbi:hypothetical protein ACQP0C_36195 [Nocardia sp. CA-129566]|uniref:hypothetical protein n=1 Tax=Nocardia sp. CA-129566 TaxID=3239976 RepID=UPI003D9925F2
MGSQEVKHAISQLRGDVNSLYELTHATDSAAKAANRTVRTAGRHLRQLEKRTGRQLAIVIATRRQHGMAAEQPGSRQAKVNTDAQQLKAGLTRLADRIDGLRDRTSRIRMQGDALDQRAGVSRKRRAQFEPQLGQLHARTMQLIARIHQIDRENRLLMTRLTQLDRLVCEIVSQDR